MNDFNSPLYATGPRGDVSDRYGFISTADIIKEAEQLGWVPRQNSIQRIRKDAEHRAGYQKHMVRFSQPATSALAVGDSKPELVLINSHDRTSTFKFMAGLFRLVCSNGLVIAEGGAMSISVKHTIASAQQAIHKATEAITTLVPAMAHNQQAMQAVAISYKEQEEFLRQAVDLRWPQEEKPDVHFSTLASANRIQDSRLNVWATFNIAQEKLVERGGRFLLNQRGHAIRAKRITAIDANIKLNIALYALAVAWSRGKGAEIIDI